MSDEIIWGAEIDASNGEVKLPWLHDDEVVACHWGKNWGGSWMLNVPVDCVHGWGVDFKIKLPADHWYYQDFVKIKKLTIEEAQYDELCLDTLEALGLLRREPTIIDRFEEHHGVLDNRQRDILEIFVEYLDNVEKTLEEWDVE